MWGRIQKYVRNTHEIESWEYGLTCLWELYVGLYHNMLWGGYDLIERNPPLGGGFLFTMFPDQEPGGRGPPSKHPVQILRGGSSSSGFLIREHSK